MLINPPVCFLSMCYELSAMISLNDINTFIMTSKSVFLGGIENTNKLQTCNIHYQVIIENTSQASLTQYNFTCRLCARDVTKLLSDSQNGLLQELKILYFIQNSDLLKVKHISRLLEP